MLPSKEKSFPIGLVNFQFKLVDIFSSFTNATFSYTWNYGDGTIEAALGNTTHVYDDTGHFVVAVGVSASQHGREYHSLLHKNISIRGKFEANLVSIYLCRNKMLYLWSYYNIAHRDTEFCYNTLHMF